MDEITLNNSSRILKFLQQLKLDFNENSIWNYARKKFHFRDDDRYLIHQSLEFLRDNEYIVKVRRPGYYRLSEKGENFINWDLEKLEKANLEVEKPVQKSWMSWLQLSKV
ncbi:hypothetical protein [Lutimonas sp.]|uniref:hypothetical protein n=1 Tax=Lutimonas sp. TaxID=1872403 RepID=UPI003C74B205